MERYYKELLDEQDNDIKWLRRANVNQRIENKKLQEENEKLNNIIKEIKNIYQSLCFSAPENNYVFIEQLGKVLQELKGSDKE